MRDTKMIEIISILTYNMSRDRHWITTLVRNMQFNEYSRDPPSSARCRSWSDRHMMTSGVGTLSMKMSHIVDTDPTPDFNAHTHKHTHNQLTVGHIGPQAQRIAAISLRAV